MTLRLSVHAYNQNHEQIIHIQESLWQTLLGCSFVTTASLTHSQTRHFKDQEDEDTINARTHTAPWNPPPLPDVSWDFQDSFSEVPMCPSRALLAQGARQRQIILESFTLWEKKIMSSTFIFLLIYYSSFERLVQNLLFFLSPKTVKYIYCSIALFQTGVMTI